MKVARKTLQVLKESAWYRRYQQHRLLTRLHTWTALDARLKAFYAPFVTPGSLCFDVGANIGNRSKIFLALGARVVAVEPQQSCIQLLERRFSGSNRFSLVRAALGEREGRAEIQISDAHTVSSMNTAWIERVQASGRFTDIQWTRRAEVPVTTLDRLIHEFGVPGFIKIDVEGYEAFVLKGLSRPVAAASVEYTPEFTDAAVACIQHLASLGAYELNLSRGESLAFVSDSWITPDAMIAYLKSLDMHLHNWGDIYFRLLRPAAPAAPQPFYESH